MEEAQHADVSRTSVSHSSQAPCSSTSCRGSVLQLLLREPPADSRVEAACVLTALKDPLRAMNP